MTPKPRPERPCVAPGPHLIAVLLVAAEHASVPIEAERIASRIRRAADPETELATQLRLIETDGRRAA